MAFMTPMVLAHLPTSTGHCLGMFALKQEALHVFSYTYINDSGICAYIISEFKIEMWRIMVYLDNTSLRERSPTMDSDHTLKNAGSQTWLESQQS